MTSFFYRVLNHCDVQSDVVNTPHCSVSNIFYSMMAKLKSVTKCEQIIDALTDAEV